MAKGQLNPHRVLIDLVPIRPGKGGAGGGIWRYACELVRHLDKIQNLGNIEIHCLIVSEQREFFTDMHRVNLHVFPDLRGIGLLRLLWIHVVLPTVCLLLRARVLHKLATETSLFSPARRVTTVHDFMSEFIWEKARGEFDVVGYYFRWMSRVCFQKSCAVISVSDTIRQEAQRRFPETETEIVTIHHGVQPVALSNDGQVNANPPYHVLCVAQFAPHKGLIEVLEGFERLLLDRPELIGQIRLELHGFPSSPAYLDALHARMEKVVPSGAIKISPFNKNLTISEIFRHADLFILLSQYEGFGLPVVESQALGIPVLCSDIPALREVGEDGAYYVDRSDSDAVANALYKILTERELYEKLQRAGLRNVARFSWYVTASQTLEVYQRVCA